MRKQHIIQLENGIAFIAMFILYVQFDFSIMYFFLLLFVPDISIIGYAINPRIGARMYNVVHSFVIPSAMLIVALFVHIDSLYFISIIWLAHIFMDRSLGFGLKYADAFQPTHIQKI